MNQSEEGKKAYEDAVTYGRGIMKDGKHIPIEDIYKKPNKCHTNCVGKQACLQLVKDGKNEILDKLEEEIKDNSFFAYEYTDEKFVNLSDALAIIASMRVE